MSTTQHAELGARLAEYGQEHLLHHWHAISDEQRVQLAADIADLDLAELREFFGRATSSLADTDAAAAAAQRIDDLLQPIPDAQLLNAADCSAAERQRYEATGLRQIAAGRVGVVLMAGGQGTRLGFAHPKGMFNVGLRSQKTLFQIQAERILRLQRLAGELVAREQKTTTTTNGGGDACNGSTDSGGGVITWYIMTSEHTREPTHAFFKRHAFFGLRPSDVVLFEQGSLPCFGFDGRILLDEPHKISRAPDGNGGIYRALCAQGMLADMRSRGIRYLHAHSVDNILIKVADPLFVGYCVEVGSDCAAKVSVVECRFQSD